MHKDISAFMAQLAGNGDVVVFLPSGHTPITESAAQIFGLMATAKTAFCRGGRVHEVVQDPDGRRRLDVLAPQALRSRIEKLGTTVSYFKNQKGEYSLNESRATSEDCKGLLATTEARTLLPPIANVYAVPMLVLHGGELILLKNGYNSEAGGAFVCSGEKVPEVPLAEAACALDNLQRDFSYVSESDRTRAKSLFLSPALRFGRFFKDRCAQHVGESDESQTGKGCHLEAGAAIYGEIPTVVTMKSGGVGSLDESLSQQLINGRPFIQLDNLRGKLDSQFLEGLLTAPGEVACRVPHRGEVLVDPHRFFFAATSNGFESTEDLANRSCIIRIRKQPRGYQFHDWPEGGLVEHVRAKQPYYLGCIHAILRAWWAAGAPRTNTCDHDFRDWARTVEGVIHFAWPDAAPLLDGHRTAQARTSNPALVWLRAVCLAIEADNRSDTKLSASDLVVVCEEHGLEIPGLHDSSNADAANKQVGMLLARCIKQDNRLVLDEFEVIRTVESRKRSDGQGSFDMKLYEVRAYIRPRDPALGQGTAHPAGGTTP